MPAEGPALASLRTWRAGVGFCLRSVMPEPTSHTQDEIDAAAASFHGPELTLDELMAGVEPIRSMEQLDIPDLTDDERQAFAAALDAA
jgi:hypothetical protein